MFNLLNFCGTMLNTVYRIINRFEQNLVVFVLIVQATACLLFYFIWNESFQLLLKTPIYIERELKKCIYNGV